MITNEAVKTSATNIIPAGNVVIATRVGLGKVCILGQDTAINQDLRGVVPYDNKILSNRFLLFWFRSIAAQIVAEGTGATVQGVKLPFVKSLRVPMPSLSEQKRIVGILDKAFEGIAKAKASAEKNLQHISALFQAVLSRAVRGEITRDWRGDRRTKRSSAESDLNELLRQIRERHRKTVRSQETTGHEAIATAIPREWQLAPIGSLFNLIDYRGKNPPRSKTGRRLITAKNIRKGFLADEPVTFISEETYRKWMVRGFPKPGDILFVTEGHTMGFVALNTRDDHFALAQRTITFQPIVPFSTGFFFYFMLSSYFQDLVKVNATGAAAVGMKASKVRSLPVPYPPLAEQQVIAAKLDALSQETQRLESIYRQKLAALEALKKSLLNEAFSGRM